MTDVISELFEVIESRKGQGPDQSYVASLHAKGLNKILEKVGEEAVETVLAAKDGDQQELIKEVADLWFHTLVMLSHVGIDQAEVQAELANRFGTSGLVEKANRS